MWSVGFGLALMAVSLMLAQAYRTARHADAMREFLAHTSRVLSGVQHLETLAARLEADQRGFLIAGATDLERAREGEYAEALRVVANLRSLLQDDAAQTQRLAAAEQALRQRRARMLQTAALAADGGLPAARAAFDAHAEQGYEAVRATLLVLRNAEQQRLATFTTAAGDSARDFNGAVGVGSLLALLLLLFCCAALWGQMRRAELAHERLLLNEQRIRQILQTASDAFIAIDTQGRIEEWNAQAERMFGWSRAEAMGQTLAELAIPERYRDAHRTGLARYLAEGHGPVINRRIEISAVDRSGREFPIELTIWPTRTATQISFNAFLQDITERKTAQDAIRKLNTELTAQARQLADTNRELESFSYSVSHDLRAPLRHMSGYAQILREEAAEGLDAPLLRYVDEISASARRMGALIDDLLAFSRLSRQALTPIRVDMNAVVAEAMDNADLAQNPQARIDVAPLPAAHGDPVLLRQVWSNLLSNAVKYSAPRGALARIRIEGEREDDRVRYRVRDNGVGFDPRYADKLFGVFQRLHPEDEFEGTGVGLAIVHRIVARHHGLVSADSRPGEGAEFVFELPTDLPEEMRV
ncbi:sensor histidine kinase [Lysobacter terrae]